MLIKRLPLISLILFFILISFKQSQAGVLRLFLSGGAEQLGSGGFSLTNKLQSDLDLLHPTSLLRTPAGSRGFGSRGFGSTGFQPVKNTGKQWSGEMPDFSAPATRKGAGSNGNGANKEVGSDPDNDTSI